MRNEEQLVLLVDDIAAFLQAWQARLSDPTALDAVESSAQAARADVLGRRAGELGSGGLAHHLARCSGALRDPQPNVHALREALRAVSEISWQLREEMRSADRVRTKGERRAAASAALGRPLVEPPMLAASFAAGLPLEASSSAVPDPIPATDRPGSLATLFGLRAFGHAPAPEQRSVEGKPASAPRRAAAGSLFHFRAVSPARLQPAPPPLLSIRDGLPPLAAARREPGALVAVNADLDDRLQQLRRVSRPSRRRSRGSRRAAVPNTVPRSVRRASRISWGIVLLITVPLGLLLGNAVLLLDHYLRSRAREPETVSFALDRGPRDRRQSSLAAAAPTAAEQLRVLTARIHGPGGAESPELSALLDTEATVAYRTLSQSCTGSAACESQRLAQDLLTLRQLPVSATRPPSAPPRWLAGLTIPAIGAHDDPEVQRWLEYYAGHAVGRELFQTLLFRCGAHQDLINKTLIHHGLPLDLLAVVLAESACASAAESAAGARGLWQFMPLTARAYHLLVQEGVVDERLSPVKSTEAAVQFLADLYRKLGSWEMALASYNGGSGPFRMLVRLQQAGASATFWDLAKARLIPEETARYVPRIQAYALLLANLRHFDFSTAQTHAAEETADLEVPSHARLGQVARAAGTSVSYLRSLNPDLVGTVIPALPGNHFVLQVPKSSAFRAREVLKDVLLEKLDLCVSSAFDWGRQRFTAEMQAQCEARRSP